METLKQRLGSLGVQVVSDCGQPDGARRLQLRSADGLPLEVALSQAMLAGSRDDAMSFLEELLKHGTQPQRNRGSRQ